MPTLNKNTLTPVVDLPTWEWTRFAPAASNATSASCAADNGNFFQDEHGRYIYYWATGAVMLRYDTVADSWQRLTDPPRGMATASSMKFAGALGPEGKVISATSTTLQIAAISTQSLVGFDVVIVSGTGAGQRRTITAAAEAVVHDTLLATGVNNAVGNITVADSLKAWTVNQWADYTVRVSHNPTLSAGQTRRILSNSATTLVIADPAQTNKPWNNPSPFAPTISATAGSQTTFTIESQTVTLDSAWATTPDATSVYRIQSGMILFVVGTTDGLTPFYSVMTYDILTDTWYLLPSYTSFAGGTFTDIAIDRTTENSTIWERGIATSGTTTTLVDATHGVDAPNWRTNQWAGYWLFITSGTGEGQIRQIASNTGNTLTWSTAGTAPTATSRYMILGFDAGTATSGAASTLTDSTKAWATNRWANYVVRILAGTGRGQVRQIISNTATALTLYSAWTTNPDSTSVYAIQGDSDRLYIMFAGAGGAIGIHNMDSMVATFGRQFDWGIARNASASVAGHQPVAISSLANATTTATVTTAHAHQFKVGELVTVRGATDANFNVTNVAIATVPSTTTFTYTMAGTPAATTIVGSQSTTTLTDFSKNWVTNEHAGRLVYMNVGAVTIGSGATTGQTVRIASNTANTLTFVSTSTAPVNGTSRYSICTNSAIGGADSGLATGTQSTTTIQDTTKTWPVNFWAGRRVRVLTSVGAFGESVIASNTSNTLTVSTAFASAPVSGTSQYVILDQGSRGTGISANWAFGTTDASAAGRYLYTPRGGGFYGFERVDLVTDRCSYITTYPLSETLTTGTMSAYDGQNRIYFTRDATQRVYSLDVTTGKIRGAGQYPYAAPTAVIGNRMEIMTTKDGLKYLYLNRASNNEWFRCLLFW